MKQNRVTPFGQIEALPFRGALTGNRGILHNPVTRTLHPTRRWSSKAWIYCLCDFKGRQRDVMGANGPAGTAGWTNLFFYDEACALAAGHRPCFYCQRIRASAFRDCWQMAHGVAPKAPDMDRTLHYERLDGVDKRVHPLLSPWQALPVGCFITDGKAAFCISKNGLLTWTADGYQLASKPPEAAKLITPPSIVAVIRAGFSPQIAVDFAQVTRQS